MTQPSMYVYKEMTKLAGLVSKKDGISLQWVFDMGGMGVLCGMQVYLVCADVTII